MKETLAQRLEKKGFSGVLFSKEEGHVIHEIALGYAHRDELINNTLTTKFGIASGTKTFTALAIMRLIDQGKLTLDDRVFDHLPIHFPTYDANITVEHLLSHRSGLPDYYDEALIQQQGLPSLSKPWCALKKPADYLAVFPQTPQVFSPGEKFQYNNSAYILLALLIETLKGDFYQFMKDEIFTPFGLIDTGFYAFNQLPPNTALGYIEDELRGYRTNIYEMPVVGCGDGGLYTTKRDLEVFWEAFYQDALITKASRENMLTPRTNLKQVSYGLGIWLEQAEDRLIPYMLGEDPGVSFTSSFDVKSKRLEIILSNTQEGRTIAESVITSI